MKSNALNMNMDKNLPEDFAQLLAKENLNQARKNLQSGFDGTHQLFGANDGDSSDLSDKLNKIIGDNDTAPATTTVVTVPNSPQDLEIELLDQAQVLAAYIQVLTSYVVYNKHPKEYDLSDKAQAAQYVNDSANAKNLVLSGGVTKDIAEYFPNMQITSESKDISTTTASLHLDLLKAMFGSLDLTPAVLREIDGILTEITGKLKSIDLSFSSEEETVNHTVSFFRLEDVPGSKPVIQQMALNFLYLEIDQKSWKVSVAKSSVEHFSFKMRLTQSKSILSHLLVKEHLPKIQKTLETLTKNDAATISKLMNAKAVTADAAPAK